MKNRQVRKYIEIADRVRLLPASVLEPIYVRCTNKAHKISLSQSGKLILHHHKKEHISADTALAILANKQPCRCFRVLEAWKGYSRTLPCQASKILPSKLLLLRKLLLEGKLRVTTAKPYRPLTVQAYPLLCKKIGVLFCETMLLSYNFWPLDNKLHCLKTLPIEVRVIGNAKVNSIVRASQLLTGYVGINWYTRIYKQGFAIVNGFPVMNIIDDLGSKKVVEIARYSLSTGRYTKVEITKQDRWHITKWLRK